MGDFYEPEDMRRPPGPAELLRFERAQRRGNPLDSLWIPLIAFVVVALMGALALRADWPSLGRAMAKTGRAVAAAITPPAFRACTHALQSTCVVDGDTFRLRGETVRIADIDTPEVSDFTCAEEKALGERATARLTVLLNEGPFELQTKGREKDQYGRLLRKVYREGESLGDVLVSEGLAEEWKGRRSSWCGKRAVALTRASTAGGSR